MRKIKIAGRQNPNLYYLKHTSNLSKDKGAPQRLKIPCHHIVVNMVLPGTPCGFCESKRQEQRQVIQKLIRERSATHEVAEVPRLPDPIRGMGRLTEFSKLIG